MLKYVPLPFLQERILELQHALFFNSCNAVLKISDQVIDALCIDEVGQIWFAVPRPLQSIQEFDREFPAKLNFFKKGKKFYVKVAGKAFIVNDPEELNGLHCVPEETRQKVRNREVVLVKLKIQYADYFETTHEASHNWLIKMKAQLSNWVFFQQHGHRSVQPKKISFHDLAHLPKIFSN